MGGVGKSIASPNTVVTPDGITIGVGDYLLYGQDSGHKPIPQAILDFEQKRKSAKIEFGVIVDDNGNVIYSAKGGRTGVKMSVLALRAGSFASHNHPRTGEEEGFLGGTFSSPDIRSFSSNPLPTFRAVASEGTYSITKIPGFDGPGLYNAYKHFESVQQSTFSKNQDAVAQKYAPLASQIKADYHSGKISYSEVVSKLQAQKKQYLGELKALANRDLIDAHNWFLANQKKYGYTYGLER